MLRQMLSKVKLKLGMIVNEEDQEHARGGDLVLLLLRTTEPRPHARHPRPPPSTRAPKPQTLKPQILHSFAQTWDLVLPALISELLHS